MRSLYTRPYRLPLIALVVALWGGGAVMDWYGLYSVGGWLGSVLVLFIASYVPLAILGGGGAGHRVRRRSAPLIIALVVVIEGATIVALRYRLALESWLNLVLAFFAVSYLLVAVADALRHTLWRWRRFGWRTVAIPCPAHRGSSDAVSCVAPTGSERRLVSYLQHWSVPGPAGSGGCGGNTCSRRTSESAHYRPPAHTVSPVRLSACRRVHWLSGGCSCLCGSISPIAVG